MRLRRTQFVWMAHLESLRIPKETLAFDLPAVQNAICRGLGAEDAHPGGPSEQH
jgi:hypothetical protein